MKKSISMKKNMKRLSKYILITVLSVSMAFPAMARTKAEVQEEIAYLEGQQQQLESELESLKKDKQDTETYIKALDKKIKKYLKKVEKVSAEIAATEAEITITLENLEVAKANEKEQYAALKARIKAMYEAGDESYLQMLVAADDLKSYLNGQEYMSRINEYDHNLLVSLQETRDRIAAYEKELEEQKELQEAQKKEYELEKKALEKVVAQKEEELVAISENMDDVAEDILVTEAEIEAENALLQQIIEEERRAAEEAARKRREEEARRQAEEERRRQEAEEDDSDDYDDDDDDDYDDYDDDDDDDDYSGGGSSTGLIWPCGSTYITSYFGYRSAPTAGATTYHAGIDIGASYGSSIYAAASGTVVTATYNSAMGNYMVISHGNGVSTIYEHCSALYYSAGAYVSQGTTIAAVGSTGISTGAHLHFGVSVGGEYVNPLYYVSP